MNSGPTLQAVTVHGRTGPQLSYAGIELIGRPVTNIDTILLQRAADDEISLIVNFGGLGPEGLHMYVLATRAGDVAVSEALFCTQDWNDYH